MFPKVNFLGTPTDTYSICFLLTLMVVFAAFLILRPREFPFKYAFWQISILIFFAIVGGMLLNIVLHASEHKGESLIEMLKSAGMASLGGQILALFALWIFCRIVKVSFLVSADYAAPFFMLVQAFGRIGCLAYGCCYGIPSGLPCAYAFKSWGITSIVPRHPTQAYMLISALAILASSRYLYKKAKVIPGVFGLTHREAPTSGITFFYVVLSYSAIRFFIEFLRAEGPFIYGVIKISHITLAIFAVVGAIGLSTIIRKSPSKSDILKALKAAAVRLVVWLAVSGITLLSLLSLRGR